MAIQMANRASEHPVLIVTDSEYCYNVFSKQWFRVWRKNKDRNGNWHTSKNERVKNQSLIQEILDAVEESRGTVSCNKSKEERTLFKTLKWFSGLLGACQRTIRRSLQLRS